MNLERKLALIKANQDKIFSVEFIKKDGTLRKMTAKLGVTKHLRGGGKNTCDTYDHLVTVFDMEKKAYRNINVNTLVSMKGLGQEHFFKEV